MRWVFVSAIIVVGIVATLAGMFGARSCIANVEEASRHDFEQHTFGHGDMAAPDTVAVEAQAITVVGTYTGFVGSAINVSGVNAFIYDGDGLAVLDIAAPANIHKIDGRPYADAGIQAIDRDGGLLYVAVDRPIGLGDDYLELLATEPITLLSTYQPPTIEVSPLRHFMT